MNNSIKLELPSNISYIENGIEDFISKETLSYHYGKHHKTYVDKAVNLISGTEYESKSLIDIIKMSENVNIPLFNNAAQVWNHSFYWNSLSAHSQDLEVVSPKLHQLLISAFGSVDNFAKEFTAIALGQFGSGWAWLVYNKDNQSLELQKTSNALTPVVCDNIVPLITIDVWEHAYYIDHFNRRDLYIEKCLQYINWQYAAQNLQNI